MKQLTEIVDNLAIALKEHEQLKKIFDDFANFIETDEEYTHKLKIRIILNLEPGFFTIVFTDKVLDFVFTTFYEDKTQKGKVKCYLSKGFTSIKKIKVAQFTFDRNGGTSIKEPDNNGIIYIKSNDDHKRYVLYDIINKSLFLK